MKNTITIWITGIVLLVVFITGTAKITKSNTQLESTLRVALSNDYKILEYLTEVKQSVYLINNPITEPSIADLDSEINLQEYVQFSDLMIGNIALWSIYMRPAWTLKDLTLWECYFLDTLLGADCSIYRGWILFDDLESNIEHRPEKLRILMTHSLIENLLPKMDKDWTSYEKLNLLLRK